jgi:hypothetical protein
MFQDMGWTIDAGATATPTRTPTTIPTTPTATIPVPTPSGGARNFLPLGSRSSAP